MDLTPEPLSVGEDFLNLLDSLVDACFDSDEDGNPYPRWLFGDTHVGRAEHVTDADTEVAHRVAQELAVSAAIDLSTYIDWTTPPFWTHLDAIITYAVRAALQGLIADRGPDVFPNLDDARVTIREQIDSWVDEGVIEVVFDPETEEDE